MKKTNIIATIGPASDSEEMVEKFIKAGVNTFRLNFSHGSHDDHRRYAEMIKKARKKLKTHTAILADLQGPKIRVGEIDTELLDGQEVVLVCEKAGKKEIPVQYANLYRDVKDNDTLLLDDGKIEIKVTSVRDKKIYTQVIKGGKLISNKGINLPTGTITADVITEKDIIDARFALDLGVDFLALSFVSSPEEIEDLRKIIKSSNNKDVQIIAKIERHEALSNLDKIIKVSDLIMVARGDLGIEVLPQDVPIAQKSIIKKCLAAGKPVIVATQMLESMISSPRSTRAETSDIANAILDGADATMLSGETSVGQYPLYTVKAMKAVAMNTEEWVERDDIQIGQGIERDKSETAEAVAHSAIVLAKELKAKYIIAATISGRNARAIAKYRPNADIIAVTQSDRVAGQLSLSWGVMPIVMLHQTNRELTGLIDSWLQDYHKAKKGDRVVIVSGLHQGKIGGTNLIRVHEIGDCPTEK